MTENQTTEKTNQNKQEEDTLRFKPENTSRLIGKIETEPKEHKNPDGTISHRFAVSDPSGTIFAVDVPPSPHTKDITKESKIGTIVDLIGQWETHAISTEGKNSEIPVFHPARANTRERMPNILDQFNRQLDRIMNLSPESPVLIAEEPKKDPRTPSFDPIPSIETVLVAEKRMMDREAEDLKKQETDQDRDTNKKQTLLLGKPETPQRHPDMTDEEESPHTTSTKEHKTQAYEKNTYLISGTLISEPQTNPRNPNLLTFEIVNDSFKNKSEKVYVNLEKVQAEQFEKDALAKAKIGEKIEMIGTWHKNHEGYIFKIKAFNTEQSTQAWKDAGLPPKPLETPTGKTNEPKKTRKRYNSKNNDNGLD